LPSWALICIRAQEDKGLDEVAERFLAAKTLEEAIQPISP
jgi:hypothetical protein